MEGANVVAVENFASWRCSGFAGRRLEPPPPSSGHRFLKTSSVPAPFPFSTLILAGRPWMEQSACQNRSPEIWNPQHAWK
jgi:hypothetical protein